MSKFVTYGVTEMLDNDQKFIIDSDRTGPGSITAKDAASSLLSKWAGFETFEEAVQNTISNNQEFIDRDSAIRSETAELKKKIVTTFPAKDASGAVATFESEFEDAPLKSCIVRVEPVQDLHGYDHPWPGGGGKNLFEKDNVNALDAYIANDKVTTNANHRCVYIPCKPNTTYTVQKICIGSGDQDRFSIGYTVEIPSNDAACYGIIHSTSASRVQGQMVSLSITTGQDAKYLICWISYSTGYADSIATFQLELGSTATDWTPYSNICPITGWTGCEVQRTGKNLLDPDNSAWAVGNSYRYSILMDNNKTVMQMTLSDKDASVDVTGCYIGFVEADYDFMLGGSSPNKFNWVVRDGDITTDNTNKSYYEKSFLCGAVFIYPKTQETFDKLFARWNIMVELGSTPAPYEPFSGRTYPITFPTEAGTVYGGYVDVTGGELVVDRYFANVSNVVNKSVKEGTGYFWFNTSGNIGIPAIKGTNAKLISNRFAPNYNTNESTAENVITFYANGIIRWKEHGEMTLAEYRAYLAENPFELCYELAEPIHYPLTPTEIKTLLGTNNIWSDTGDTAVEYLMSDVSWYVEKKLKAFQSVLAGVEDSAVASKNYSTNTYLVFNDDIYRVTKAITAGETIEEGVNVTKTTVAEQLMALAQA